MKFGDSTKPHRKYGGMGHLGFVAERIPEVSLAAIVMRIFP